MPDIFWLQAARALSGILTKEMRQRTAAPPYWEHLVCGTLHQVVPGTILLAVDTLACCFHDRVVHAVSYDRYFRFFFPKDVCFSARGIIYLILVPGIKYAIIRTPSNVQ